MDNFDKLPTICQHHSANCPWINGRLFPSNGPCYDNVKSVRRRVIAVKSLSNEALIDSYLKAVDLKLDRDFIQLLLAEIRRRRLNIAYYDHEARAN